MYGADTTDTETNWVGGKYNGLDYMIAYNVLWLDCLQRGCESNYIDFPVYQNRRESDCNYLSNEGLTTIFKYNGPVQRPGWQDASTNPYPKDVKITGETIELTGLQYYGDGHTLEIIPDHKVTQCEIEQYLDN